MSFPIPDGVGMISSPKPPRRKRNQITTEQKEFIYKSREDGGAAYPEIIASCNTRWPDQKLTTADLRRIVSTGRTKSKMLEEMKRTLLTTPEAQNDLTNKMTNDEAGSTIENHPNVERNSETASLLMSGPSNTSSATEPSEDFKQKSKLTTSDVQPSDYQVPLATEAAVGARRVISTSKDVFSEANRQRTVREIPIPAVSPPTTSSDHSKPDVLIIYVGREEIPFCISRRTLLAQSEYFKETFDIQQAQKVNTCVGFPFIKLVNTDPDIFFVIWDWIHTQRLIVFPALPSCDFVNLSQIVSQSSLIKKLYAQAITRLIEVYGLAVELMMPELMDVSINRIGNAYYHANWNPSFEDIKTLYTMGSKYLGLRKYMAEAFARIVWLCTDAEERSKSMELLATIPDLSNDFLGLNVGTLANGNDNRKRTMGDNLVCDYHCHALNDICEYEGMDFTNV